MKKKLTGIAPMIGNLLGSTNVEYVNDPNMMPAGGLYDMHGNMLPNSQQIYNAYVLELTKMVILLKVLLV